MIRALALLALVLAPVAALGEEERGTTCDLHAFVDADDTGVLALYDGLRKGLELAQLPRVCQAELDPRTGIAGFLEQLAAEASLLLTEGRPIGPVFAVGDVSAEALVAAGTRLPRVFAVERYTSARKPLRPLPADEGAAVVYADLSVEAVGALLRRLTGTSRPAVAWAWDAKVFPPSAHEPVMAFGQAAKVLLKGAEKKAGVQALLHLRLGVGERLLPFDEAVRLARELGVPLISDDRGRFGQGAVVTLVARHRLVGRLAADAARRLRAEPGKVPAPRAVPGVEVWIDLKSADAQGVAVPLPLLAGADRLKRGVRFVRGTK
ncbi:MAG: hypothetical protein QNJ90_02665 [Planctomycetota bacterium]|nr:hypothetical protein [Planctomycetota bacterium]